MLNRKLILTSGLSSVLILLALFGGQSSASQKSPAVPPPVLLTRTATRHEIRHFGYGGTVTIVGAPKGSVTVEGWQRSEVEVTADIEQQAETEADLDQLAKVNGFVFDDDVNHVSILTTGTHDRSFMKKTAKNFPKRLLNLPWKIDYRIRVPASTDVEINAGHGPVNASGFEGALRISAVESETTLTLAGGLVTATVAAGNVRLIIPVRSWRGSGADIRIAAGILTVELPPGFNGDIDADILRTGRIENAFDGLAPREKPGIGEQLVRARAGAGGAFFKFTVGDGRISIKKAVEGE